MSHSINPPRRLRRQKAGNMNRKQIIDFCNDSIFPHIGIKESFFVNCKEVIRIVTIWRRENNYPATMTASVDDGFLFLNQEPVARIAPKKPRTAFNEEVYQAEGRILARQEQR